MEAKTEARIQELVRKMMEQQTNGFGIAADGQSSHVTRIYYRRKRPANKRGGTSLLFSVDVLSLL